MQRELITNSGTNQISSIRIKAFFDQQVDLAQIDGAEIDCDFFGVAALWAQRVECCLFLHFSIHITSTWMVIGWFRVHCNFRIRSRAYSRVRCLIQFVGLHNEARHVSVWACKRRLSMGVPDEPVVGGPRSPFFVVRRGLRATSLSHDSGQVSAALSDV